MTTCLRKSCSVGLMCMPFVNFCQVIKYNSIPLCVYGGIWNLIVSVPDHRLSFYFKLHSTHYTLLFRSPGSSVA